MKAETCKELIDLAYATVDIHQLRRLVMIAAEASKTMDELLTSQIDIMRRHTAIEAAQAKERIYQ